MKTKHVIFISLVTIAFLFCAFVFSNQALAYVHISSPANGETVGGVVPVVVSYWTPDPGWPIYEIGGGLLYHYFSPPVVSGSYTFYWNTSAYTNGSTVTIYMTDNANSVDYPYRSSDTITVTVNNPPPAISFTSPGDGSYILPTQSTLTVTIAFHIVLPNTHGINYASLQLSGNGIYPVTRYYYPPSPQSSGTFSADFTMSSYPLGVYTLSGYCTDDSGKSNRVQINITKGIPPGPNIDPKVQPPQDKTTAVGHPINVATGNVFTSHKDILIPARELSLELSRTYNSQDDFNGQFGYGWRSNFDITLKEYPDGAVVEADETGVYTLYSKNGDGTYTPSAGKYSILTKNADNTFTLLRKHGQKLYFDTAGRLKRIEGRNGNAITIQRDAAGAILEVTDPSVRKLTFANSGGRITQITDPAGRIFQYSYDAGGNLIQVIDSANNVSSYQYDANHKLIVETDANGHSFNFEYNADNRAYRSWQEGNNNAVTLSFDRADSKTTVTDSRGNATVYEYNNYGLVTKITDAQNYTQLIVWDGNMNKTSVADQNSHTTTYTYDGRGNLLTSTDPLSNTATFTYEPVFDFIKTITDTQNNVTTYDYDPKGNLTKLTDALGHITTNTYDELGQLTNTTNPKNFTTTFTYDDYGNLTTTTDALGNTTIFSYDAIGNRTQTKDAKNNITQFTYNSLNQLTQITYPDSSINSFTYDAVGNKLSSTDSAGNTTNYTYDLDNRLILTTNPLGKTIAFEYNTEGDRTKVIDQNLHETTYQYDTLNRLVSETNPLGLTRIYSYDPVGNKTILTDAKGNTITYEYDNVNRLKKINYSDSSSVIFTYDSLGRRISMTDSQGTTNYTYDNLGRLTQVNGPKDNDTLQYTYDELGNRISLTLPDGKIVHYTYDALNRISSITDSNNKTTAYTYDEVGDPINVNYPNNIQAGYTFDALHRLTRLTNQNQTTQTKLSEFIYTYDAAGRRSRIESLDVVTDYNYDALGELIGEVKRSTTNPYQIVYEYDFSGNRTRMLKNGTEHLYTYNNANQLTQDDITGPVQMPVTVTGTVSDANGIQSLTVNGSSATLNGNNFTVQINLSNGQNPITVSAMDVAGNTATKTLNVTYAQTEHIVYLYDNNGNLIKKQSSAQELNLSYDYENRLTSVIVSPPLVGEAIYKYDGEGKRISSLTGSTTTNYLYDGINVILEQDVLGNPVTSYLRNPNAAGGIGGIINTQVLSPQAAPEIYYSYDGLGSVTNLSDTSGANLQSYNYDAFGNAQVSQPGGIANTHQFLTKETDPSGLIYFGARYYDPSIGRFITQDPSGMANGPNMYLYCLNNPVNFIDLWGLCVKEPGLQEQWATELGFGFTGFYLIKGAGYALVSGLSVAENTTVVYSGGEAAKAAAAASTGIPIFKTFIGGVMNWVESAGVKFPQAVWDTASRIYAESARGTVQVFLSEGAKYTGTFARIEAPILEALEALGKVEIIYKR